MGGRKGGEGGDGRKEHGAKPCDKDKKSEEGRKSGAAINASVGIFFVSIIDASRLSERLLLSTPARSLRLPFLSALCVTPYPFPPFSLYSTFIKQVLSIYVFFLKK